MALTVSQEMPDQERRQRLIHGLKATSAEKVHVDISHLAQAIGGIEAAEPYIEKATEMSQLQSSSYRKDLTKICGGSALIDRAAVLNKLLELEEAAKKAPAQKTLFNKEAEKNPSA